MNTIKHIFCIVLGAITLIVLAGCQKERELVSEEVIVWDYEYRNYSDKYVNKGMDRFEQVETYYEFTSKFTLDGEILSDSKGVHDKIADTNIGEHGHVWLEKRGGEIWCCHDHLKMDNGRKRTIAYETKMKIVEGSWEGYKNGDLLTLINTEEGDRAKEDAHIVMYDKSIRETYLILETEKAMEKGESLNPKNLEIHSEYEFYKHHQMTLRAQGNTIQLSRSVPQKMKITTIKKVYK